MPLRSLSFDCFFLSHLSSPMAELVKNSDVDSNTTPTDDSKSPSLLEASFDEKDRFASLDHKKLLRKVDWHLLPYIIVSYMVVRLDLNNINNAGTMNQETGDSLKQVLKLDAQQWSWVSSLPRSLPVLDTDMVHDRSLAASTTLIWSRERLSVLLICPSLTFAKSNREPICTFFLRPASPSRWLARIMVSWAAVMCTMACVKVSFLLSCQFRVPSPSNDWIPLSFAGYFE